MSLSQYNNKRNFTKTAEPQGKQKSSKKNLRFVVQKHDASHVHYDFRLEMEGALKSWAVPKGPSLNPADKRLAMMVEDHPFDYRNFEGVIPAGEYGGGTVIVWDEGTYEPSGIEGLSRAEQEKALLQQLHAGKLNFILHGKKLQGEFTLFLMRGRGERSWILVKNKDHWSSTDDITQNEKSVKTGKTLVEVALDNGTEVNHPEAHGEGRKTGKKEAAERKVKLLATPATKKEAAKKSEKTAKRKAATPKPKTSGLQIDAEAGKDQQLIINGKELQVTNLSKIYWKKEGFTKGAMLNYYLEIAPYILPYILNRPHSLNRHPNGTEAANFYQKDVRGKVPEWIETFDEFSESTDTTIQYLVCSNEATLIYMANLGCIEINPWHGRVGTTLQPDWCIIDLDPDKTNSFEQVIEVANVVKKILDAIGADSCVKTSGSTGIHIYIPLAAKYTFDQSKQFAELIVNLAHAELPHFTSVERNPANRKGKVYLDFLQNRETQTAAAPYSLRPKPGVPVSTPLHWTEVKNGLTPTTYTAYNIFDRLKTEGDLFKPVLQKGIDLEKVLKKVQALVK
jgi:bifunctional non-homologous end joining protein LigD